MSSFYKLFCLAENQIVYTWSSTVPTVCPNNSVHEIVSDSVKVADSKYNNIIKAEEDSDGFFTTESIVMDIPSGTPGDITEHDVTWPMDILLWRTLITPTSDMLSDKMSVVAAPETTIGVLTATANIGVTTINVNSTVTDNVSRGFLITLDDTVNKNVVGRCSAVDSVAGTISFETATTNSFAAGTPVKISVYVLNNVYITDTNTIDIGTKGMKGKTITTSDRVRVYYENNSGTTKTLYWRAEYYAMG